MGLAESVKKGESGETKETSAAYDACTKSGAFALLLSVCLALLIPYWHNRSFESAAGKYTAARQNLDIWVEAVGNSDIWKQYVVSHPDAESESLSELSTATIQFSISSKPKPPSVAAQTEPENPNAPAPPTLTNVTISGTVALYGIQQIGDAVNGVSDSATLTDARRASSYFNVSILDWVIARNFMVFGNQLRYGCIYKDPGVTSNNPFFVAPVDQNGIMKCLTFHDVRQLAKLAKPEIPSPFQVTGHIARDVDVNPGNLPRDLVPATVVAEVLLLFTLVYFGAFLRELLSRAIFPENLTLFSAFAARRWTLATLLVIFLTPVVCTIAIAVVAHTVFFEFAAAGTTAVVVAIIADLRGRGYWANLFSWLEVHNDIAQQEDMFE